jgi:hypothetical protein
LSYSISEPGLDDLFDNVAAAETPEQICGTIFYACNVTNATGYNYLQDTGFSTFGECYNLCTTK